MKLERGERSILASFTDGPDAEKAGRLLREAGYTEVQVDRIGGFGDGAGETKARATMGGIESQVTTSLRETAQYKDDVRVLLAATPEASGMAGAPTQMVPPFLVTVMTAGDRVDEAVGILQRCGGRV